MVLQRRLPWLAAHDTHATTEIVATSLTARRKKVTPWFSSHLHSILVELTEMRAKKFPLYKTLQKPAE